MAFTCNNNNNNNNTKNQSMPLHTQLINHINILAFELAFICCNIQLRNTKQTTTTTTTTTNFLSLSLAHAKIIIIIVIKVGKKWDDSPEKHHLPVTRAKMMTNTMRMAINIAATIPMMAPTPNSIPENGCFLVEKKVHVILCRKSFKTLYPSQLFQKVPSNSKITISIEKCYCLLFLEC